MAVNTFLQALRSRQPLMGLWANLDGCAATEVLGATPGLDWIGIDCEHTPRDAADVLTQLRILAASPVAPVVRLASHDAGRIAALLDIGVCNLIAPHVETPEQARAVVRATRYPPQGVRGYASGHRAGAYGRDKHYGANAHDTVCLIAMAETREAMGHIVEIATTEGVDAIYIGAADLACDMGFMGQPSHPEVKAVIETALKSVAAAGCASGISAQTRVLRSEYQALGASLFAVGQDVLLFGAAIERHIAAMNH